MDPDDRPRRPSSAVGPRVRPAAGTPTRPPAAAPRGRGLAGAALALAGVSLGVGALVVLNGRAVPEVVQTSTGPETGTGDAPERVAEPVRAVPEGAGQEGVGQGDLPELLTLPPAPPGPPGPPDPTEPPAPVVAPAPPAPEVAPVAPARPALTVLNNSRVPRLAAQQAERYRAAGWPVAVVGNLRGRIAATTVYYPAGQRAAAQALAAELGVPRVLPRLPGLPGRGLTVVVTRDLA